MGIGFDALVERLSKKTDIEKVEVDEKYYEEVIRLMERQGIYKCGEDGVKIVGERLFKVNIELDDNVI